MKLIFSKIKLFLVVSILYTATAYAQKFHTVSMEVERYGIRDSSLVNILDSLMKREQKCSYYDKSLVWVLFFRPLRNCKCTLEITMAESVVSVPKGYFVHNGTVVMVYGQSVEYPFNKTKTKRKFKFRVPDIPYPSDYSTWYLDWEQDRYVIRESYFLPCD